MKAWELHYINKHLPELISSTKYNDFMGDILIQHRCLSIEEAKNLSREMDRQGNTAATSALISILKTHIQGYAAYADALFQSGQSGAFYVLLQGVFQYLAAQPGETLSTEENFYINLKNRKVADSDLWDTLKSHYEHRILQKNDWFNFIHNVDEPFWGVPMPFAQMDRTKSDGEPIGKDVYQREPKQVSNSGIYYFPHKLLGSGGSSVVFAGYVWKDKSNANTKRQAAVKKYKRNVNNAKLFETELTNWIKLTNETVTGNVNIIRFYDSFKYEKNGDVKYYIAMELGETDLDNELDLLRDKEGPVDDPNYIHVRTGYLRDILKAIQYLHNLKHSFVHRDIKPANIFIFKKSNETCIKKFAKLGDFGSSRIVYDGDEVRSTVVAGTLGFMAPECKEAFIDGITLKLNTAQDIYSFGKTCNYVMSWKKSLHSPEPDNVDIVARQIIKNMMEINPDARPSCKEVAMHPFFFTLELKLKFIFLVARSLESEESVQEQVREKIDAEFCSSWEAFNWKKLIGEDNYEKIRTVKSTGQKKNYKTTSVTSFIKMLRDKFAHSMDIVNDMVDFRTDYNNVTTFDDDKFILFFLEKFPSLWPFLYNVVRDPKYKEIFVNVTLNLEKMTACE